MLLALWGSVVSRVVELGYLWLRRCVARGTVSICRLVCVALWCWVCS